ncbi:MAG: CDP-diacylglycerol--serine O-phosphatidyltransferase [Calditrichaceae bacterium]|nr:CDP-diacylglycerol--serine O-phosphatidyltransferase [Calditrichaceae bacterium]MBN2709382.1 CDP-diacylglycerol--serine O-phosphatidyltransferase [Calditrichaceae bacterium]RQV95755.1 MAG: CDP-diacylglycerol--serine O-phosphatidyltransferase [Calditrichota bacterium]
MIRVTRAIVPNFFTIGNMFCGFMSIIYSMYNQDYIMASWMIMLAGFLDAMDGKVARLTNTSSKFGVEYDSLADVVSFGVAPSVLVYAFLFSEWKMVGIFISFFPLLFGSIRLARFNVQLEGYDKSHFTGLPSPIAAGTLASYIIFKGEFFPFVIWPKILLILTFTVAVLMVSRIRYEIVPNLTFRGDRRQKIIFAVIIFTIITLILFPQGLLFPYILIYILSGLIRFVYRLARRRGIQK